MTERVSPQTIWNWEVFGAEIEIWAQGTFFFQSQKKEKECPGVNVKQIRRKHAALQLPLVPKIKFCVGSKIFKHPIGLTLK